ncbi:MAG: amidohydrolase family protein [Chloroflexi bacterium]|nr:amidohydrolase family protein [Chloroflexota bacterium]
MTGASDEPGGAPSAERAALCVDAHAHIWPHGIVHPSQRSPSPLAAEPEDLRRATTAADVDVAIVLPASVHEDNDFVLRAAVRSRDRQAAVVAIDPWRTEAVTELRRCAEAGALGVRIAPRSLAGEFAAERGPLADVIDAAVDLDLVVQWTVPLASTEPIAFAGGLRSGLRHVLDHLGLPERADDLAGLAVVRELATLPGLHVKLSGFYAMSRAGYPYSDTWSWAEGVVAAFGSSRTLWASDWPLSTESAPYRAQRDLVAKLPFLDDADRQQILGGTAIRLFRLDQAGRHGADPIRA